MIEEPISGVPWWWLSGLRIQHCHCCGIGLIPGPGAPLLAVNVAKTNTPPTKRHGLSHQTNDEKGLATY